MSKGTGQITKKRHTKPTVMTNEVVCKLANKIADGNSVEMACTLAGVGRSTFYEYINNNPDMAEMFERMRGLPLEKARCNIVDAINDGDIKTSKWFLERMDPEKFNPKFFTEETVAATQKVKRRLNNNLL